jgi:diketogulonate reductase-like aldo/keto reductase
MKKQIEIRNEKLFPIGIGTWGIGGFADQDPEVDEDKQLKALVYMLNNGFNFVDVCYWNSQGRAAELTAQAIEQAEVDRKDLFLVNSMYHYRYDSLAEFAEEMDVVLDLFAIDHVDTVQFLLPAFSQWGEDNCFKLLHSFLEQKKTRYVSISNADLQFLKKMKKEFGDKFFSHEVQINYEIRANADAEIIDYADQHDLLNVVYQPLRRNRTAQRNWPLLVELAEKYGKTQNQIIMNWHVSSGRLPITKSETISYIDQHLQALEFDLEKEDLARIDAFRPKGFNPDIDWQRTGDGVRIDQLSNIFDEQYQQ